MDLTPVFSALATGGTPLVRADFTDDAAWGMVVALVGGQSEDDHRPHVPLIDDPALLGIEPGDFARSHRSSQDVFGHALLADNRSMAEARAGGEVTVVYVDLCGDDPVDAGEDGGDSWLGRSFRCATGEIASVEDNLSIANLDFADFAGAVSPDGVYRGEHAEPQPLIVPEAAAGLASSVRIGRDVDGAEGARVLSGETGEVESVRTIRGTRRRLFECCAHVTSWSDHVAPSPGWSWIGQPGEDLGKDSWAFSRNHPDQLTGSEGAVRTVFVEVDRPRRVVRRWQWMRLPASASDTTIDHFVAVLPEESRLTVELTQSRDDHGEAWTEIRVHHENLPVEWLDDMRAWWDLQLAIADHGAFGSSTR